MKLCQVPGFPRHYFSAVHIRSFTHPHGVILGSSGQIRYISCHTGAYFPHLAREAIVPTHIRYSLHHSAEIYCIRLAGPLFLSPSSMWALSGASFETRRAPFSHLQRIEICSGVPLWGMPLSLGSSDHLQILSLLDLLLDLHGSSHWGIPSSLSLSGLLCTSSLLSPFLDLCELSYWGIPPSLSSLTFCKLLSLLDLFLDLCELSPRAYPPLALFYWGISPSLWVYRVSC